jgi:pimeloyl-ACP methyl ester carboxylesterase
VPFLEVAPSLCIHYLEINQGGSPTVLLLHGLGANSSSWVLQIPALAEAGFRVQAPDVIEFLMEN